MTDEGVDGSGVTDTGAESMSVTEKADGSATDEGQGRAASSRLAASVSFWRRPPGFPFHGMMILPVLTLLWAVSVPGSVFLLWLPSLVALGAGALVWGLRLILYLVAMARIKAARGAWWFLVAPVGGALCLGLLFLEVPLQVRWQLSRSGFEGVVDDAMSDRDYFSVDDQRVGLYQVNRVYRQDDAVIFYERNGAFIDDAGFAYLPEGPYPELANGGFESPQFRHLGGPWYAWTAGW